MNESLRGRAVLACAVSMLLACCKTPTPTPVLADFVTPMQLYCPTFNAYNTYLSRLKDTHLSIESNTLKIIEIRLLAIKI